MKRLLLALLLALPVLAHGQMAGGVMESQRQGTAAISGGTIAGQTRGVLVSKGVLLGESQIAAYSGLNGVSTYLLTTSDSLAGSTVTTLANPGDTILQQQTAWTADANKATYDWIIVHIGSNDLLWSESAATALARYQTLINTINAGKKSTAIVVVSAITPLKSRLVDLYGGTNGATAYTKWQDMNTAIMGGGASAITGVNYRINKHVTALGDGSDNLATVYDALGDHAHASNNGRAIITSTFREVLNRAGFFPSVPPMLVRPELVADQVVLGGGDGLPLKSSTTLTYSASTLTVAGSVKSTATNAIAQFVALDLYNAQYPAAVFQIGNTSGDLGATFLASPLFSSAGVSKPMTLKVTTNKTTTDSTNREIWLYQNGTTDAWIGAFGGDGNTAGTPLKFSTQAGFNNAAVAIYIGNTASQLIGLGGIVVPTARLHLPASAAAANSASLKIPPGTVATVAVSGNIESDGTHIYWTDSGGTRRQLDN